MGEKSDVRFVLFLNCPLKICEDRIMERAKTSGRVDDNIGKTELGMGMLFRLLIDIILS